MEDIPTFLRDNKYQFTPEYWWPTNRTWCLCSEYDLKFTLLAGSNDLISAVLNSTTLEALGSESADAYRRLRTAAAMNALKLANRANSEFGS